MISGVMIGGMVTALLVSVALTLGAFIVYFKKRENVQGTFFILVIGMMGVVFTQTLADVVATIVQLPALMEYSYLLSLVLYGLIVAVIDMLIRLYFVGFMGKSGVGRIRATVFSCGYVAGLCLMPACNQFMYILYARMINQGVFLEGLEVGTEQYQQMLLFQESLTNASPMLHYAEAANYIARAILYCFICMALVRGTLEGKKGKSFAVLLGIRAGFEMIYQMILALCSEEGGAVYSDTTALLLSIILSVLVIAGGLYAFRGLLKEYPSGREPRIKGASVKQRGMAEAERKKNLAWQEIRNMNSEKSAEPKTSAEEKATEEKTEESESETETKEKLTEEVAASEEKTGDA